MAKIRVLVVEDGTDNRAFLSEYASIIADQENIDLRISAEIQNQDLNSYDYPLETDVLVLDFNLIGITGLQILERIRKPNNPNFHIPVIFVPGLLCSLGSPEYREKLYREMNVIGIFEKPYVINTVIGRVKDWHRKKEG